MADASPARAVRHARTVGGDDLLLLAGRMHTAGSVRKAGGPIVGERDVVGLVEAGADVVLLPAPGTVPGCHEALVRGWVEAAHDAGALTMTMTTTMPTFAPRRRVPTSTPSAGSR